MRWVVLNQCSSNLASLYHVIKKQRIVKKKKFIVAGVKKDSGQPFDPPACDLNT